MLQHSTYYCTLVVFIFKVCVYILGSDVSTDIYPNDNVIFNVDIKVLLGCDVIYQHIKSI